MTDLMTELTVLPVADPVAELPPREETPERVSLGMWVASLVAVIVPLLGLVGLAWNVQVPGKQVQAAQRTGRNLPEVAGHR